MATLFRLWLWLWDQINDISQFSNVTHRLALSEAAYAYKIFQEKEEDCVKVVLKP